MNTIYLILFGICLIPVGPLIIMAAVLPDGPVRATCQIAVLPFVIGAYVFANLHRPTK